MPRGATRLLGQRTSPPPARAVPPSREARASREGAAAMQQAVTPSGTSGHRGTGPSPRLPAATSLLAALLLVAVLSLHAQGTGASTGPVYSLAQIDAHLAQQPERWVGRTLRLWALA